MKRLLFMVLIMFSLFQIDAEASSSTNSLMNEYAAEEMVEAKAEHDIINAFYNNLCKQKGIAIKYDKKIDFETVNTLFQKALSIDAPANFYDGVMLWANIEKFENAIVKKDGFYYIFLKVEYRYDFDDMKKYVNETSEMLDLKNRADKDKVNIIYNYINTNYKYDDTLSIFDCINAQKNENRMVCQGYSTLAYLLGKEAGLDIEILISETHSWNCVKIDGSDYIQFDITNGYELGNIDNNKDMYTVRNDYFLYSNKNIKLQKNNKIFEIFG